VRIAAAQINGELAVIFFLACRFVVPRPVATFVVIRRFGVLEIITRQTDI
jgi:hypothetical protein